MNQITAPTCPRSGRPRLENSWYANRTPRGRALGCYDLAKLPLRIGPRDRRISHVQTLGER